MNLMHGDCLKVLDSIPDQSVDLVCADPPYGTTACRWDSVIDLELMWEHIKRVTRPNSAVVLNSSQPYTSALVMSNPAWFKYCWVWVKNRATGHVHAKNKPMKIHEDVCVFSSGTTVHASQSNSRMPYYPQGLKECRTVRKRNDSGDDAVMSKRKSHKQTVSTHIGYPTTRLNFPIEMNDKRFHPTQKPIELVRYLVTTYSKPGDLVLDFCMGSGTTGVACELTGREFIGIEKEKKYFDLAKQRIEDATRQGRMFA